MPIYSATDKSWIAISLFGLSKSLLETRKREQQPFISRYESFRIGFNLSRLYSFVLVFQKFCLRLPWKSQVKGFSEK